MNEHVKVEHRVDRTLSPSDKMFEGNSDHYFGVGFSALENIQSAVSIAKIKPATVLDFGCGAGRVTRWIAAAFPHANIEGCDIREGDIKFVSETFSLRTWQSVVDPVKLNPPSSYDLIWVGSVFTHLSKDASTQLFDKLTSWLNPNGILVFTSHGRYAASAGPASGYYGIPSEWSRVVEDYTRSEFGYADYRDTPGYGISLTQLRWWAGLITSRQNLRLISMTEHSWDDHQDVIAVQLVI
jgi:SAM-dependent methyltransferase